jgi:hypothetical protein
MPAHKIMALFTSFRSARPAKQDLIRSGILPTDVHVHCRGRAPSGAPRSAVDGLLDRLMGARPPHRAGEKHRAFLLPREVAVTVPAPPLADCTSLTEIRRCESREPDRGACGGFGSRDRQLHKPGDQ